MIYIVKINDKEYEVEVEKGQANIVKTTQVTAPVVAAPVAPQPQPQAAAAPSPAVSVDGQAIKAPIPGTILDIKVSSGASVKKGQIILILEAMKMENEIVAPVDGVIKQIVVAKGASVATNDVLFVM